MAKIKKKCYFYYSIQVFLQINIQKSFIKPCVQYGYYSEQNKTPPHSLGVAAVSMFLG